MKSLILLFSLSWIHSTIIRTKTSKFGKLLKHSDVVLLKVTASWCKDSKKLDPIFREISERKELSHVTFAEIDSEDDRQAMTMFNIKSLPGVFIIVKDISIRLQYLGPLEVLPFNEFIAYSFLKQILPFSNERVSLAIESQDYIGHALFCPGNDQMLDLIKSVYPATNGFPIFSLRSNQCSSYDLDEGEIVFIRKSGTKEFSDTLNSHSDVYRFLRYAAFDPLNVLDSTIVDLALGYQLPLLMLYLKSENEEIEAIIKELASTQARYYFVCVLNRMGNDFEKDFGQSISSPANLNDKGSIFVIFLGREIVKFQYPHDNISSEQVQSFVNSFIEKSGTNKVLLDDVDIEEGKVIIMKLRSLEQFVLLPDRRKLILFHQNSCAKCQDAISIIEYLAKEFEEVKNRIVFARIEIDEKRSEKQMKLPAFKFYSDGAVPKSTYFEGELKKNELKRFLKEKLKSFDQNSSDDEL